MAEDVKDSLKRLQQEKMKNFLDPMYPPAPPKEHSFTFESGKTMKESEIYNALKGDKLTTEEMSDLQDVDEDTKASMKMRKYLFDQKNDYDSYLNDKDPKSKKTKENIYIRKYGPKYST